MSLQPFLLVFKTLRQTSSLYVNIFVILLFSKNGLPKSEAYHSTPVTSLSALFCTKENYPPPPPPHPPI